jgi:hypothetical protein
VANFGDSGFKSVRSYSVSLCPWARHLTLLASLDPGVWMGTGNNWGSSLFYTIIPSGGINAPSHLLLQKLGCALALMSHNLVLAENAQQTPNSKQKKRRAVQKHDLQGRPYKYFSIWLRPYSIFQSKSSADSQWLEAGVKYDLLHFNLGWECEFQSTKAGCCKGKIWITSIVSNLRKNRAFWLLHRQPCRHSTRGRHWQESYYTRGSHAQVWKEATQRRCTSISRLLP